jgi:hypothetical protein
MCKVSINGASRGALAIDDSSELAADKHQGLVAEKKSNT